MSAAVNIPRRGLMLVLSSPSGAGKTTIARMLIEQDNEITLSVSATTRPARPGEKDGSDYHFITPERFTAMVAEEEFLEYARVFDNYYGTPRRPVEAILSTGKDVLFDIDWQGTQQLAQSARVDLVSIFILPPSLSELERRLRGRAQDSEDVVIKRMSKAMDEMSHWREYDYIIVNNDPKDSAAKVQAILKAERLRRDRQIGLHLFLKNLQEQQAL